METRARQEDHWRVTRGPVSKNSRSGTMFRYIVPGRRRKCGLSCVWSCAKARCEDATLWALVSGIVTDFWQSAGVARRPARTRRQGLPASRRLSPALTARAARAKGSPNALLRRARRGRARLATEAATSRPRSARRQQRVNQPENCPVTPPCILNPPCYSHGAGKAARWNHWAHLQRRRCAMQSNCSISRALGNSRATLGAGTSDLPQAVRNSKQRCARMRRSIKGSGALARCRNRRSFAGRRFRLSSG